MIKAHRSSPQVRIALSVYITVPSCSRKLHLSTAASVHLSIPFELNEQRLEPIYFLLQNRYAFHAPSFRLIIQTTPGTQISFQKSNHSRELLFDCINESSSLDYSQY